MATHHTEEHWGAKCFHCGRPAALVIDRIPACELSECRRALTRRTTTIENASEAVLSGAARAIDLIHDALSPTKLNLTMTTVTGLTS